MFQELDTRYSLMKQSEEELLEKLAEHKYKDIGCKHTLTNLTTYYKRYMTFYKRWEDQEILLDNLLESILM